MRRLLWVIAAVAFVVTPALVLARPLPGAPRCPIFPANNPWNERVDHLPVAAGSARYIASIGLDAPVHPDFGTVWDGAPNGIPYAVVSDSTPKVPVSFLYASESDRGPYPIPRNVPIEGGPHGSGDRHVIVVDRSTCTDYELYDAYPNDGGRRWTAGSGAIFNLRSDRAAPGRMDLGRRRRAADPARARALRRGRRRRHQPCAALHRAVHRRPLRLPRPTRCLDLLRAPGCRRWVCACG